MKKKFLKAAVLAGLICLVAGAGGCGQNREEASGETQEERGSGETEAAAKASEGSGAETEAAEASEGSGVEIESTETSEGSGAETESTAEETAAAGTETETAAEDAEMAPDFETVLSTGETVKLSDFRGKKVLLNFWATWCGYCIMEFPALERLSEDYPDDLTVLAIDCGEDADTVQAFLEQNEYSFLIGMDEAYEVQRLYPTNGIPYTVLIDENGAVMHRTTGIPSRDEDEIYEFYRENLGLE